MPKVRSGPGQRRSGRLLALAAGLMAAAFPVAARADDVSDFYRGRTIEILVGAGAGGGYDLNARLLARHLGRFIPGNPAVIVNNMPGGGGITATNFLFNVAPKNGLVLGTFSNAMLTQPLFGADSVKFDPQRFGWLGSTSREDGVCIVASATGVSAWEQLRGRRLVVGTTAPGTTTHLFPTLLNRLFGVDFKFVTGYSDGSQIILALERGEVEAVCQTWSSLKISHPELLARGVVRPLLFVGLGVNPELANLPSINDLAVDPEQRQILKIVLAPTAAGRPFAAPPGIPPERLTALRLAFSAATADAVFLDEARKARVEASPLDGAGIDALLTEIFSPPPAVIERMRSIVATPGSR